MSFLGLTRALCGLTALACLSACGNIGPLYLPDDPHPPIHHVAAPVAPADSMLPATAGSMSRPASSGSVGGQP